MFNSRHCPWSAAHTTLFYLYLQVVDDIHENTAFSLGLFEGVSCTLKSNLKLF